jgi:predicted nuclease of predicted toxin-antitoxin system
MLVLLDENLLSRKLKQPIVEAGYTVCNVDNMGWRGTKDRDILALADAYPFDVFITADKNLPHQQNISDYKLKIIVLNTKTTKPDYLIPLIEQACLIISTLTPGSITLIDDDRQVTLFQPNNL